MLVTENIKFASDKYKLHLSTDKKIHDDEWIDVDFIFEEKNNKFVKKDPFFTISEWNSLYYFLINRNDVFFDKNIQLIEPSFQIIFLSTQKLINIILWLELVPPWEKEKYLSVIFSINDVTIWQTKP